MTRIATLGPRNTFAERAAQLFTKRIVPAPTIELYPTIKKAFCAVGQECELGLLPIENMVDGYVQPLLDLLLHSELYIVDELLLPVQFAFVANAPTLEQVQRVYAQFVTQGQCSDFLDSLTHQELITTPSNGASLEQVLKADPADGALIPLHALEQNSFAQVIHAVNDYANNTTRFIAIGPQPTPYNKHLLYKTSLVIVEGMDRPGMLSDILQAFSHHNINLLAIISRPTKEMLGRYHFFMDIEGHADMPHIQQAFGEVREFNDVKFLGSYPRALSS